MSDFLLFFELMPTWQKGAWILLCLSGGVVAETARPLFQFGYHKWSHARVNLVFLATTLAINTLFTIASVGVFAWIDRARIGMLHLVDLPVWAELVIALAVFDLIAQYGIHVLLHKVPWMWRFHMVHHSDVKVDATTGTRHHPGDYVLREMASLFAVVVVGAPIAFYIIYRMVTVFFTYFTHANFGMPVGLDRRLSWLVVTPNMHKFHHHRDLPWTDSNYGNILSIWDRLLGTRVYEDVLDVRYGLNVLPEETDQSLVYQLKLPFDASIGSSGAGAR